ncbi:MAG: NADPH-dependent glutamate synthase [Acidimicrobiia bacterium]|nr:NADPH-dependent glutamate synthase [Acidimicrobiia bacterium]
MPMRGPQDRVGDFDEVSLGLSLAAAQHEAERCRLCTRSPCVDGCPVGIDIPRFIAALMDGDLDRAHAVISERNALPAVCGRVCAMDEQCERLCILEKRHDSVAIGSLERFVGDWRRANPVEATAPSPNAATTAGRVAVVGSGPAGLTAAQDLAKMGYEVTVFEALHRPGGVLVYGIPRFRLPLDVIDEEIQNITRLGVQIRTNHVVGRTTSLDRLCSEFDAVFLATGAGLPIFLGIPGESLVGVYSGNEFLMRVNLMGAHRFPESDTPVRTGHRVVVVGGGDTSLDCARTALRLGADVSLLYRRSRELMPCRSEEIDHAIEEGVDLQCETTPVRIVGDGRVAAVECTRLGPGAPDASGRASPVPVPGSEFTIDCDTVIIAIGFGVNPTVSRSAPDLRVDERGVVWTDEHLATSKRGVFAGGDLATGGATVILAVAQGRRAAKSIDAYLSGRHHDLAVSAAPWLSTPTPPVGLI